MNLFASNTREPFEKFVDCRAFVETFKQGSYG